jgi:tetratricopeptide (TPR) repeat protein
MLLLALFLFINTWAFSEALPDWFIPLREAVYEQQLSADEILSLYQRVSAEANTSLSADALYIMLSRCEYMMGRAYQFEERKQEAALRYAEGINWAEKALEERASAEAWQMLAENISQSCAVRGTAYAMANGLKVERYAKNALALNSRNAAAQYMIAARWVFAPSPFHNYRRGIEMMTAILENGDMGKDDRFNVNLAIGYAYVQQKKYSDARPWLVRALEIYPTHKYAKELLSKS